MSITTLGDPAAPSITTESNSSDDELVARREQRFAEGVRSLRAGAAAFRLDERLFMVLGGALIPMGAIVVLLGWWGAAHSTYVFDQIPYVISGGLLGVGMIFLGAFFYFTHWVTQLVQDNRRQATALLDALQRLETQVTALGQPGATGVVKASHGVAALASGDDTLVATARGSMAHRPDCAVVVGKSGLRRVSASDGLADCRLCGSG
ncbi:MAG: hypothetical protein WD691_01670 [Acidimicrobiales bacterium]